MDLGITRSAVEVMVKGFIVMTERSPVFNHPIGCPSTYKGSTSDVTVISPMQKLTIKRCNYNPRSHPWFWWGKKESLSFQFLSLLWHFLCSLGGMVETCRGWSCEAMKTIKAIGRLQSQKLGLPSSENTSHIFQQLAIRLWRGNTCIHVDHAHQFDTNDWWYHMTLNTLYVLPL